jgi:energy-coupling factor transport system permease protein
MALDGIIGQYYHRASIVHALDPRIKLTLLLACIVLAFLVNSFLGLALLLGLLVAVMLLSRIPFTAILKALAPLAFLLLVPFLFNLFFISDGTPLLETGFIRITNEGIWRGAYMTLRLLFLFGVATMVTLTTSTIALSDAVAAMLAPFTRFGVPAFEISMMVSIALRFIPTLLDSFYDIKKAQLARGAHLDAGGPLRRIRGLVPLLVPLFAGAFRHAEELAIAMESRCYHGGERTHYRALRMQARDFVAIVAVATMAVVLCVLLFV